MEKKESGLDRRSFITHAGLAAAGLTLMPSMLAANRRSSRSINEKLNIAGVGVGGRGFAVLKAMESENIVALCDVDWKYAQGCFDYFPEAKKYWDWRKMFDEMGKDIDAVVIATADHTHAIIAAQAITMGKHVYVEKPLTHTVYESRLLTKLAAKYGVATQMGNQGASEEGVAISTEW